MNCDAEPQTITVMQYNVGGSRNTMAEVLRDSRHWKFDIIAFQEPYLNRFGAEIQTHNPIKDRFRCFITNHKRARVATFINRAIPTGDIELTDYGPNFTAVTIRSRLIETEHRTTIYNVYNPNPEPPFDSETGLPQRSPLAKLNRALAERTTHSNVVVGDFNLKHELWGGPAARETACPRAVEYLLDTLERHSLRLCFETGCPTRMAQGNALTDSTIDMAFATPDVLDRLVRSGPRTEHDKGSDHLPIITTFGALVSRAAQEERYLLKQIEPDIFNATLNIHLPHVPPSGLSNSELDDLSERIQQAITEAIKQSAPKADLGPKSRPGWTPECTEAIKECRRAKRHWRDSRCDSDYTAYQLAKRHKRKTINRALTQEHRHRLTQIEDMRDVWKVAKWAKTRGTPRSSFTPDIKNAHGIPQKTTQGKADALKHSFFPTPPTADEEDINNTQYPTPIIAPDITVDEVIRTIKRTSPDKAPGPDQIPNRVLRLAVDTLAKAASESLQ
jgi:exonuclease III